MADSRIRELIQPLGLDSFIPLGDNCRVVQTKKRLSDKEVQKLAKLLEGRPEVTFRVYGWEFEDLEFLRFLPHLQDFSLDCYKLKSLAGPRFVSTDLKHLVVGETERPLSLGLIERFHALQTLYLSGRHKESAVVAKLTSLRKLALASTAIRDLSSLRALRNLRALELRLGSALDISPLPEIGELRYLEIWMMRGLRDIAPIGDISSLRFLFLQDLPQVTQLANMSNMACLERVHIEHLKGLLSLRELAEVPALRELLLINMKQVNLEMLRPIVGHPTLQYLAVGTGSARRNDEIKLLFNLPSPPIPNVEEILGD